MASCIKRIAARYCAERCDLNPCCPTTFDLVTEILSNSGDLQSIAVFELIIKAPEYWELAANRSKILLRKLATVGQILLSSSRLPRFNGLSGACHVPT